MHKIKSKINMTVFMQNCLSLFWNEEADADAFFRDAGCIADAAATVDADGQGDLLAGFERPADDLLYIRCIDAVFGGFVYMFANRWLNARIERWVTNDVEAAERAANGDRCVGITVMVRS